VPRRPLPDAKPSDGGVEKRRVGVKRDDRRTSHGRADGSNMIVEDERVIFERLEDWEIGK
jgi:hypothetical protein